MTPCGRRRADAMCLVGVPRVDRVLVGVGVDGRGRDPQLLAGPEDPDRDLAAVGDQDSQEPSSMTATA